MTCSLAIIRRANDLCIERNITINKLATLSGFTQSTISSMMKGTAKSPRP